jgi:PHD/YefM family antitoxin component YafN of YafNO toxin-antitoxin module
MMTVRENTTIAAISELRNKSEAILHSLKENRVILERHKRPIAVMLDFKRFEAMEKMIDFAEDYILRSIALQRDKNSKPSDFIDIESW